MKLLKEVRNESIGYPQILLEGEGGWRPVSPLASIAGTCITLSSLLSAVLLFFVVVFIHTNFFEKYKNLQGKALLFDEKSQMYKSSETTTCWPIKNKELQYIRDYNQFMNS